MATPIWFLLCAGLVGILALMWPEKVRELWRAMKPRRKQAPTIRTNPAPARTGARPPVIESDYEREPVKPRSHYFMIASAEIIFFVALTVVILKLVLDFGLVTSTLLAVIIWALAFAWSRLLNSFFINCPKLSTMILVNPWKTIEEQADPTQTLSTLSMRPIKTGWNGLIIGEYVGWVIDLSKKITIIVDVSSVTKDNVPVTLTAQIELTPLAGRYTHVVQYDDDTIRKHFEALTRGQLMGMIPNYYAYDCTDERGVVHEGIFKQFKNEKLQEDFYDFLGGPGRVDPEEARYATFTNCPQIVACALNKGYQEAAEAKAVAEKHAQAIQLLKGAGLTPKQAMMAALVAQGKRTDGLVDHSYSVSGLENNTGTVIFGNAYGVGGGGGGKKNKKNRDADQDKTT